MNDSNNWRATIMPDLDIPLGNYCYFKCIFRLFLILMFFYKKIYTFLGKYMPPIHCCNWIDWSCLRLIISWNIEGATNSVLTFAIDHPQKLPVLGQFWICLRQITLFHWSYSRVHGMKLIDWLFLASHLEDGEAANYNFIFSMKNLLFTMFFSVLVWTTLNFSDMSE